MSQFRLVILDNAKEQLDSSVAKNILADMLFVKQKNFLRTDPQYVVMDKHDMIGTHYLIYETSELYHPRLIFALRTTYLERAREHRLETPLMSLLPQMSTELQQAFQEFHALHPKLADCNAWFVDPEFSKKNSGLNLADLGYFMVCMNLLRAGYDNFIGCGNETYKATRWLSSVGRMRRGMMFEHPAVKSPHMLVLLDQFNLEHFAEVYAQNKDLIDHTYEVLPGTEKVLSLPEFVTDLFNGKKVPVAS